ncbi:protein toll-like [Bactrocera dorsalis]|uniref:Protein toll-like n=1 Tax=Bactrocera dorsalis TaxID=27457 RepID=A0ABM3JJI2_BACDO|nr:protein toll-like [Bactrocera dorsalis]
MCTIYAFLANFVILSNQFLIAQTFKGELTIFTNKPEYFPDCPTGEIISCRCDGNVNCIATDLFGNISIAFSPKSKKMSVTCYTESKNTDFLLEHDFQSILLKTRFLLVKYCTDFTPIKHLSTQVLELLIYIYPQNKVTVILNRDIDNDRDIRLADLFLATNLEVIIKLSADSYDVPKNLFRGCFALQTLSVKNLYQNMTLQNLTQLHFRRVGELRRLDLAGNNMKILNKNVFATLSRLNFLNLSHNGIVELFPNQFANLGQLIILDLSYNSLTYLRPELFERTPLLWQLKLKGNQLYDTKNIIQVLKPLNFLHRLDLSDNKLRAIWGRTSYAKASATLAANLRYSNMFMTLNLAEGLNYISTLQPKKHHESKPKLKFINLSRNLLSGFNMDWIFEIGITCPFKINLKKNLIKHVYALSNLLGTTNDCKGEIIMTGNHIECDCKLAWIYNNNYRRFFSDLQCNQKSTKLLTNFTQLQRHELCAWQPVQCSRNCVCSTKSELLHINCKGAQLDVIEELPRPEQVLLTTSLLDISNNRFTNLPLNTTFGYANVSQLYAANNQITKISLLELPTDLTVLDLRNNRLKSLSADFLRVFLNESTKLQSLYLSANPWLCDCASHQLLYTVRVHRQRIPDVEQLRCDNKQNVTLLTASLSELCQTEDNVKRYQYMIATIITAALIIIIFLLIIALFFKYKLQVKIWLYGHNILRCCIREYELDENKTFDAFISYAHQEADFVNHILLPQLEHGEPPFRVCTHERNWLAGAYIPEQIIESVEQSRRTIIVLSQHFIVSEWARMEFRTAHQCSLNEGRARIIMIKYGEIINSELLDKELKAYLDMNTYLDWQDARFWDKLRYAMPHKVDRKPNTDMLEVNGRMYVMGQVEVNRLHGENA